MWGKLTPASRLMEEISFEERNQQAAENTGKRNKRAQMPLHKVSFGFS